MTLAYTFTPLCEFYTTDKVSNVNLYLKKEDIALPSPLAACSETVQFPRKSKGRFSAADRKCSGMWYVTSNE